MRAQTAINLLNKQRGEIAALRSLGSDSSQFDLWYRKTKDVLTRLYNEGSPQVSEFDSYSFSSPIYSSSNFDNDSRSFYINGLNSIDDQLASLISEIEDQGVSVLPVTEANLKHQYTGLLGAKVLWLAIFTLLPVLVTLKVPKLGIHASPASLVFTLYHLLGIYIWINVQQIKVSEKAAEIRRNSVKLCNRLHALVSVLVWIVFLLLALTYFVKLQVGFFGSHSIPFPEWVRQFVGVTENK